MAEQIFPTLEMERSCWDDGKTLVAGIDEVGRGAWAGPLTVGVAVLDPANVPTGLRDSKALLPAAREALFEVLTPACVAWSVGHASHEECDQLGMSAAQRLATSRALGELGASPDAFLVDGKWNFVGLPGTRMMVKGDAHCCSIAAASVLAKVTRDALMRGVSGDYPLYDFASNKGYPSPRHKEALAAWGPSEIHRRSWSFMDTLVGEGRLFRNATLAFD